MLRKLSSAACVGTVCLLAVNVVANPSRADIVVYDNLAGGAAGISTALKADDHIDSGGFRFRHADDLTLAETTTITAVEWTGVYAADNSPPATDVFTVAFFGNNAGTPMSNPPIASFPVGNAVNRVDSTLDLGGQFDIYDYSAAINFTINGGTTYWISIYNNTFSDPNDHFYWGTLASQGNSFITGDQSENWVANANRMDFRLRAVPEPGSLVFIGLLSVVLFSARRRWLPTSIPR